MQKVLEVSDLKKIYGSRGNTYKAIDGISFSINKREFVGIIGPSGAGKTTLLNIVSTIDKPTSGGIVLKGCELGKLSKNEIARFRRENLGFIFQDFNLLDTLTIRENISLALTIAGAKVKIIDKMVVETAVMLGISDVLDRFPYQVSGGQKQRAAAARAIINNPALILADEPTGALDSKSSQMLLEALSSLNREQGTTIMMVTHDAFAASFCGRIVFIRDGKIYSELLRGAASRREFLDSILETVGMLGEGMSDVC